MCYNNRCRISTHLDIEMREEMKFSNGYSLSTDTVSCAICGQKITIPTRSASYDDDTEERSNPKEFLDWNRWDDFGFLEFEEERRLFGEGALVGIADGQLKPLVPQSKKDGGRTLFSVPDFTSGAAKWVCGPCVSTLASSQLVAGRPVAGRPSEV